MSKTIIQVHLNEKGGAAKTTSTLNIASYYALKNKKVLLIDADRQCDLTTALGIKKEKYNYDIFKFLKREGKVDLPTTQKNLYIIPGYPRFDAFFFDRFHLKKMIEEVFQDFFDFIFIDVPPIGINEHYTTSAELALCASNFFACPMDAHVFSVENLNKFLGDVFKLRDTYDLDLTLLGAYFGKVNTQKILFKEYYKRFKEEASHLLLENYIRMDTELEKSTAYGKTIYQYNPNSKGANDYQNLAEELLTKMNYNEQK